MELNVDKLKEVLNELVSDLNNECGTSTVCIFEFEDENGDPSQIQLTATNDRIIDDTAGGKYSCINT